MARARIRRVWVAAATTLALGAGCAIAVAAPLSPIDGCYNDAGLIIKDATTAACSDGLAATRWNVRGDQGPTGPQGDSGVKGQRGDAGPRGLAGKGDIRWVITKSNTSDGYDQADSSNDQAYYYWSGLRLIWFGKDVTNCTITATPETVAYNDPEPVIVTTQHYYGYVLLWTKQRSAATGLWLPSNVATNVIAAC